MKRAWYNPLSWFATAKLQPRPYTFEVGKCGGRSRDMMRLERIQAAMRKGDTNPQLVTEEAKLIDELCGERVQVKRGPDRRKQP